MAAFRFDNKNDEVSQLAVNIERVFTVTHLDVQLEQIEQLETIKMAEPRSEAPAPEPAW